MESLKKQARIAGLIYFVFAALGVFSIIYVPTVIVDTGDAATTVNNVRSNELLFRVDTLVSTTTLILFIFLVLALYHLFKEVDKRQAILMVALVLVSVAVAFGTILINIAVLLLINGADFLAAFSSDQLNAMAYFLLHFNGQAAELLELFWGLWLFPFGILVYKSRFTPRIFGVLLLIAGAAYVLSCFLFLVLPQYKAAFLPVLRILILGELPIIFWLLIAGVKEQRREISPT